jgi:hypothetical protein
MYGKFQIAACAFFASACAATVVGDEGAPTNQETPTSPVTRTVTADDFKSLGSGEALQLDLSRPGTAVSFGDSHGAIDLGRVKILLGFGLESTAADMVNVAGAAFGRDLPRDGVSIHSIFDPSKAFKPNPVCANALPGPTDCCVCGIPGRPCGGFVCLDPELQ